MSNWHYQIMQHKADDGETYLAIHEFYNMHDKKQGWTERPVPIEADTLPEMRRALLAVLTDIERHGIRDARTGEIVQAGEVVQM
jgi:hypothetical protein